MSLQSYSGTLSPTVFLVFLLISLTTCKSYGPMENSSFKSQSLHRYSRDATLFLPYHQTRAKCSSIGGACTERKDCCNGPDTGYYMSCFTTDGPDKNTCQKCKFEPDPCTGNDECCNGYECTISGGTKQCSPSESCEGTGQGCLLYQHNCCDSNEKCILDADGKSYCSTACSEVGGQCKTAGYNTPECCSGYCRADDRGLTYCFCDQLGYDCNPAANPKSCCGDLQCDSSSRKCIDCVEARGDCAGGKTCCNSFPCDSTSSTCCLAIGSTCTQDTDCCLGTNCDSSSQKCIVPCVQAGADCTGGKTCCGAMTCNSKSSTCCLPLESFCLSDSDCCPGTKCDGSSSKCVCLDAKCEKDSDCCSDFECKGKKCKGKDKCSSGLTCSSDKKCCSGYICEPLKLICLSPICDALGGIC